MSEAQRIKNKHLLTLEPGISQNQTDEMQAKGLQLVVPHGLHHTYNHAQKTWLMDIADFLSIARQRQAE